ncbi:hypothetical protein MRB53_037828 [Persea americana]|nr:hypothetical protein MRB53_037828 [Persea americana]
MEAFLRDSTIVSDTRTTLWSRPRRDSEPQTHRSGRSNLFGHPLCKAFPPWWDRYSNDCSAATFGDTGGDMNRSGSCRGALRSIASPPCSTRPAPLVLSLQSLNEPRSYTQTPLHPPSMRSYHQPDMIRQRRAPSTRRRTLRSCRREKPVKPLSRCSSLLLSSRSIGMTLGPLPHGHSPSYEIHDGQGVSEGVAMSCSRPWSRHRTS